MTKKSGRIARTVGDISVGAGRGPGQLQWYEFASRLFQGKSILDAGCGLGKGLTILSQTNPIVVGQDLDPRLARDNVVIGSLDTIESNSFDFVTSMDVIEHVEDDRNFVANLCRIAREGVFVTTPNWTITRCVWPYHLREYTPRELQALFEPYGKVQLFKGDSAGANVYPVRFPNLYHIANDMRSFPLTSLFTRAVNKVLPDSQRILGHNALFVSFAL
ncbi:bifunctional 2-polyprenyl-6-hydroxyphenol methylase/3-demethylubiquinol 3-O-methyltransferase UbiG [Sulfuricella sp. T08]|uniref:class I SAM-dependent methyltransferase n=1 Tax=Sulfuricella sp. T08 TaxID=1632857 RepID=UPI000750A9CA|nr:methyltransferase domain-containing protein [Sulfuricella sp. T08]